MKDKDSNPSKFNVLVEDKYGNILTPEQLREKIIDNELFYLNLELIKKRLNNFNKEQKNDKVI